MLARTRHGLTRSLTITAGFATLSLVVTGLAVAPAPGAHAADGPVAFWLTDANNPGGSRMERKSDLAWGSNSGGVDISVDAAQTYQSIVGFGASFTDTASYNVAQLNSSKQTEFFSDLFTRSTSSSTGIGLTWLRQPLGASDYIAPQGRSIVAATGSYFYTYQDVQANGVNVDADNRSIDMVKRALALNPNIKVMGSPWSAPGWMRQHNSILGNVGGSLKSDQEANYATYLRQVAQQYRDRGVNLDYLAIQNEPDYTPAYPGMKMDASQQARVISHLAPQLNSAGLSTKIIGWDHNWDNTSYPANVIQQAGSNVAGIGWHCYAINEDPTNGAIVTAASQSTVRNQFPGKDVFFTECSGTIADNPPDTFKDTVWWHMNYYAIPTLRNWSRSLSFWNLALDQNNGPYPTVAANPHATPPLPKDYDICPNCSGITTVNNSDSYSRNAGYYVLGHFSKFVQQGAVRLGSSEKSSGVQNVAFRNPDGTYAIVVHNGGGAQDVRISFEGKSFKQSLQENAIATFTWGTPDTTTPEGPDPIVNEADGPNGAHINTGSGKCLDLKSGSETKANGTAVQLWECNGTPKGQRWQHRTSDNSLRIRGKCLTVPSDAAGSKAELWECGARTQAWTVSGSQLRSPAGLCLAVPGNSSNIGTQLELAACSAASGQQWLAPSWTAPATANLYSLAGAGRCLGVTDQPGIGTAVRSVSCASAPSLQRPSDSSLRIAGRCVAFRPSDGSASATDGTKLILTHCTGQDEQKWESLTDSTWRVRATNQCLDLTDGNVSSAVQLQTWECASGNPNQRWSTTDPGGSGNPSGGDNPGGGDNSGGSNNGGGDTTPPATITLTPSVGSTAKTAKWSSGDLTITASGLTTTVGRSTLVTVRAARKGAATTGTIRFTHAGRSTTAPLVAGVAAFDVSAPLRAGKFGFTLQLTSSGSQPIIASGNVSVAKGTAKIGATKITRGKHGKRAIRVRKAARLTVRVTAPKSVPVTGKVHLRIGKRTIGSAKVRKVGNRYVAQIKVRASANKSRGKLRAVYTGNANLRGATKLTGLRVVR